MMLSVNQDLSFCDNLHILVSQSAFQFNKKFNIGFFDIWISISSIRAFRQITFAWHCFDGMHYLFGLGGLNERQKCGQQVFDIISAWILPKHPLQMLGGGLEFYWVNALGHCMVSCMMVIAVRGSGESPLFSYGTNELGCDAMFAHD